MHKGKYGPAGARASTLAISGLLCLSLSPGLAMAQDDSDDDDVIETITVTGTRLTQQNLVSSTAVNVLDTQMIDISGAANMSELIRTLPAAGVSGITTTNSNFTTTASGLNTVELRNLGEDRTLVLVNGRRFVAGVPGSQNVDFNAIPSAFIERIDVVTGGASAVYGSDALAGVVNIITKTDFEGVQISAQGGVSAADDDEQYTMSLTAGLPFADDRGHAMFSYTFDKENGVYARDRKGLEVDGLSQSYFTVPEDFAENVIPFFSSFSEWGRFIVPGNGLGTGTGNYIYDAGTTVPYSSATHGFNRQAFRALAVPTERNLLAANMTFAVSDATNLYMESTYSSVETESSLEPFPLSSEDLYGDNGQQCDAASCYFGVPGTNPFIPADMLDIMRTASPGFSDDQLVVGFARRMTELDQRGASNLRQTFRLVAGVEGEFGDGFTWDLSANWGRTTQNQQSTGQINVLNMRNSLDASIDPGTGEAVCNDAIAVAQGCIPVNLFGMGSITAGLDDITARNLLTYLKAPASTQAKVEQKIISGYISGNMFSMPAGDARFVVGAEYRDETSESIGDALTQQGLNAGNISPPIIGDFDVSEVFVELEIPLLADMAFAQSWDVTLAGRFSDYSTVGNTDAYAVSTKWVPHDDWLIRAQYARAVRAPNVGELFGPLSQTFPTVQDPCRGVTSVGGQTGFLNDIQDIGSGLDPATVGDGIAVACMQDPNLAARVNAAGAFVPTQSEIQGVSGFNGGAISGGFVLEAETADTVTFGFVWSPSFADGLNFSVDYYDIEIEEGIGTLGRQLSLDRCYADGAYDANSDFCAGILRWTGGPTVGAIQFSNVFQQNLSTITTSGIDVQASYAWDLPGTAGAIDFTLTYGNLLEYEIIPFVGADVAVYDGEVGLFEHEALFGIIYSRPNMQIAWSTQYMSAGNLENEGYWGGQEIGSQMFHDLQGRFMFGDMATIVVGVDNVTDEYVETGFSVPGAATGHNTIPDVYDALGRRYYLGLRLDF
jgi:outer membrane receptor protein involved in Fe transport